MLANLAAELRLKDDVASLPPQVMRKIMALGESGVMGVPALDDALALWLEWYGEVGHAPEWTRFQPFEHPGLLPHIILYERIGERYRCAIAGQNVVANLPVKIARQFIDETIPAGTLEDVTMRLNEALATETPNFIEKTMTWVPGNDLMGYRALQLPFRGSNGDNPRVLSVLDFQSSLI